MVGRTRETEKINMLASEREKARREKEREKGGVRREREKDSGIDILERGRPNIYV